MKYQKSEVIEARQHTGLRILVVSDALGEQTAVTGDWLIGEERGKITVKTDAQFKAEGWKPYSDTPQDDQIKADQDALAELKSEVEVLKSANDALTQRNSELNGKVAELTDPAAEAESLKTQVAELTLQLAAANDAKKGAEEQLATIQEHVTSLNEAEAKADAEKQAVQDALGK